MATSKDAIQRSYLLRKLTRDSKVVAPDTPVLSYIEELKTWIKETFDRTKRPGGVGR
jgi:hypothetical protein